MEGLCRWTVSKPVAWDSSSVFKQAWRVIFGMEFGTGRMREYVRSSWSGFKIACVDDTNLDRQRRRQTYGGGDGVGASGNYMHGTGFHPVMVHFSMESGNIH
jgi:hypothetical protein